MFCTLVLDPSRKDPVIFYFKSLSSDLKRGKKATFSRSFLIVFVFSRILSGLNVAQMNVNRKKKKSEREEEKERDTVLAVENMRFP